MQNLTTSKQQRTKEPFTAETLLKVIVEVHLVTREAQNKECSQQNQVFSSADPGPCTSRMNYSMDRLRNGHFDSSLRRGSLEAHDSQIKPGAAVEPGKSLVGVKYRTMYYCVIN